MLLEGECTMSSETENSSQTDNRIDANKGGPAQPRPPIAGDNPYAAIEVGIQGRFNELQRELLADRQTSINRWVAMIALILSIGGFFGWTQLSDLEEKARTHLGEIEQIRVNAREAHEEIQNITAKNAADSLEEGVRDVQSVRENPEASLITKAIANAVSFQRIGETTEAIKKWRAIAQVAEGSDSGQASRAWLSVGYLLAENAPEDSLSAYGKAIRLRSDFAEAFASRASLYGQLKRYREGIGDLDQAIRLEPFSPYLFSNRGNMKLKSDDCDGAVADLEKALILFGPDDPEARMELERAKAKCEKR